MSSASRTPGDRPLVLIDIGTSAGLNLIWDRYAYDFGPGKVWGNPAAPVRIATELRGHLVPRLTDQPPVVAHRLGVDLHVPDLTSTAEALWLKALIWPDQPERMQRLTAAIAEWRRNPPELLEGNDLDVLADLIRTASQAATVCIVHCRTLNQFSAEQREAFHNLLAAGQGRPLLELSAERIGTAGLPLVSVPGLMRVPDESLVPQCAAGGSVARTTAAHCEANAVLDIDERRLQTD